MKKVMHLMFSSMLIAALIPLATAQETTARPPAHLYGVGAPIKLSTVIQPKPTKKGSDPVFFCLKKNCLDYEGDNDVNDPNANGLLNMNNTATGDYAEVWVSVRSGPRKSGYKLTGWAGNYYTNATGIGINPTPVAFRTGVGPGKSGKLIGSENGNAVFTVYGQGIDGLTGADVWVKQFSTGKAPNCNGCVPLGPNTKYSYNGVPQTSDPNIVFFLEDNDGKKLNERAAPGFKHLKDASFFNSPTFGANFEPTFGSSGACGGVGCDGFSVSVNGH
jgi:hypothetical protein